MNEGLFAVYHQKTPEGYYYEFHIRRDTPFEDEIISSGQKMTKVNVEKLPKHIDEELLKKFKARGMVGFVHYKVVGNSAKEIEFFPQKYLDGKIEGLNHFFVLECINHLTKNGVETISSATHKNINFDRQLELSSLEIPVGKFMPAVKWMKKLQEAKKKTGQKATVTG